MKTETCIMCLHRVFFFKFSGYPVSAGKTGAENRKQRVSIDTLQPIHIIQA